MKTIFRFASLLAAAVMLFASCGETGTGTENPTPDGPATKGELILDVDNLINQRKLGILEFIFNVLLYDFRIFTDKFNIQHDLILLLNIYDDYITLVLKIQHLFA